MGVKLFLKTFAFDSLLLLTFGVIPNVQSSSLTSPLFSSYQMGRISGQGVIQEVDKPIDKVLDAAMELGSVLFMIPRHDFDKRDPPDLGTGRSDSGQHTARVFWGQLASHSPAGPGRRKRNTKRNFHATK